MKATVTISGFGNSRITLTPETLFEKRLIEDIYNTKDVTIETSTTIPNHSYYDKREHAIVIDIESKQPEQ